MRFLFAYLQKKQYLCKRNVLNLAFGRIYIMERIE